MLCDWDLNYATCWETVYILWNYILSLRTCHVETVRVLWRNSVLNVFKVIDKSGICLVLKERDLATAWFQHDTVVKYILVRHRT